MVPSRAAFLGTSLALEIEPWPFPSFILKQGLTQALLCPGWDASCSPPAANVLLPSSARPVLQALTIWARVQCALGALPVARSSHSSQHQLLGCDVFLCLALEPQRLPYPQSGSKLVPFPRNPGSLPFAAPPAPFSFHCSFGGC